MWKIYQWYLGWPDADVLHDKVSLHTRVQGQISMSNDLSVFSYSKLKLPVCLEM